MVLHMIMIHHQPKFKSFTSSLTYAIIFQNVTRRRKADFRHKRNGCDFETQMVNFTPWGRGGEGYPFDIIFNWIEAGATHAISYPVMLLASTES